MGPNFRMVINMNINFRCDMCKTTYILRHDTTTCKFATQLEFHLINLLHNTKHGLGPTFSQIQSDKNGLINIILENQRRITLRASLFLDLSVKKGENDVSNKPTNVCQTICNLGDRSHMFGKCVFLNVSQNCMK